MKDSILPDCMMPDGAEPCKAYLAKCQEVEELKLDLKNSHSRIDTYLDQKAALQSKVTDLEAKLKIVIAQRNSWIESLCYAEALGADGARINIERADEALKEQAGEKGEES